MPTKDFIVKLVGDSKDYQSAMDQASKALAKYEKQNLSANAAMKTVTNAMTKFISVAALVKGAQEALNATIKGSQTTADGYAAAIDGCKTAVSTFFTALSTGDFSSFTQGLDQIIQKGVRASQAMDQLGNTVMSFNYLTASNNAAFNESLLTMRNANASPEERAAARKEAEKQLQYAQDLAAGKEAALMKALTNNAVKKSPLSADMFNVEDIQKISLLDALAERPDLLAKYGLQSKDYYLAQAKEYSQLIKAARPKTEAIPADLYRSEAGRAQAAEIAARNRAAVEAFNTYEAELQKEYQFALEVKALLEDISDEELQSNIFNLSTDVANTNQGITQMQRQLLAAAGELKRGAGKTGAGGAGTGSASSASGRYMSDLEYDRMIYQERIKLAEQFSDEWVALKQGLRETEYQMEVERLRATIQNEDDLAAALKLAEQVLQKDLYNIAMEGYAQRLNFRSGDIEQSTETITENINSMRDSLSGIGDGARAFEQLGHAMTQLSENKAWQGVGNAVAGVGSAIQAYMQLASAAQIAAAAEGAAETPTVWGKIATVTALIATFTTAATQIRAMNNYAEGGIIPGRNWNDGITARVSSGEMYINEADQKRLFDAIHTGNLGGGGSGPAVVTGEQIVLAINNYGRRTNRGEMVFAGR